MNESLIEIIGLFLANASLIFWFHSESKSDYRHMDAKLDIALKEMNENQKENTRLITAIHQEMKDFHGRLCAIEERRKGEK